MKLNKILALALSCALLVQPLTMTATATELDAEAIQQFVGEVETAEEVEETAEEVEETTEEAEETAEEAEETAAEVEEATEEVTEDTVLAEDKVTKKVTAEDEGVSTVATYEDAQKFVYSDVNKTILVGYNGASNTITIPSSVVTINYNAFYNNQVLVKVTIPGTVEVIGQSAFEYCTNLSTIVMGSGVKQIYSSAFSGCKALTSVTIPSTVESIGNWAFYECVALTSVSIGNNVTSIGSSVFRGCKALTSLTIGSKVESIGASAFADCTSLKSVTIPSSVKSIDTYAFGGCTSLTSFTVPDTVTSIGTALFQGNTSLASAYISRNVTSIPEYTFYGCTSLKSVTMGPYVKSVGYSSFYECSSLVSMELPDMVTSIFSMAFYNCTNLTSLYVPASVTSVNSWAFYNTPKLTVQCYEGSYMHRLAFSDSSLSYKLVDVNTVKNLTASSYGKNNVLLKYTFDANADGYLIYGKRGSNGGYGYIGMSFNDYFIDTKAYESVYNFYWVIPFRYDLTGTIVAGQTVRYVYAKGICPAVTNLKASSKTNGVQLSWTYSRLADGYLVYGIRDGGSYGYVGMTSGVGKTTFTDTKASRTGWNFYWVFPFHYNSSGKMIVGETPVYTYGKAL